MSGETKDVDAPRRQRKLPETRRAEILDAAQSLFFDRGWDAVTIADVLTEADISKGGFYHHFTAKEDLLDGILDRFTTEALAGAEAARAATKGNALVRFNAFLAETSRWRASAGPQIRFLADLMLRPDTDGLFHRITDAMNAAALPVMRDLIRQGVQEGLFDVPDLELVAETIMAMTPSRRAALVAALTLARAGQIEGAARHIDDRMAAEAALMDRLLGLPPGSIVLCDPAEHRQILTAICARPT
ncbi:transcriptional regulator, TetR family [Loktanella fryxellensis]|uniref:Transcriptional regulator, TetR family n=1 Tax=Loktanella fryxellensis TaxID=245187 RepID=A0A1H8JBK2_9RHOB|nr:TetR/AcrR family transcriptional regulator [Loktanella fryxellensis]SEN78039.1 transcriptional regulator, TetR family [Loktanella fryxellensis]